MAPYSAQLACHPQPPVRDGFLDSGGDGLAAGVTQDVTWSPRNGRPPERGVERERASRSGEASRGPGASACGLDVAIARGRLRHESFQQLAHRLRHLVHGTIEGDFVGLRWLREAAQLSHELQRRGADLIVGGRRREVVQGLDASTHERSSRSKDPSDHVELTEVAFDRLLGGEVETPAFQPHHFCSVTLRSSVTTAWPALNSGEYLPAME